MKENADSTRNGSLGVGQTINIFFHDTGLPSHSESRPDPNRGPVPTPSSSPCHSSRAHGILGSRGHASVAGLVTHSLCTYGWTCGCQFSVSLSFRLRWTKETNHLHNPLQRVEVARRRPWSMRTLPFILVLRQRQRPRPTRMSSSLPSS